MKLLYTTALLALVVQASCAQGLVCGDGTEAKNDPATGMTVCTGKIPMKYVQCDPATTMVTGGICVGDPSKFPKCGDGTKLDAASNTCISTGMTGCALPPPCPPKPGKFSLRGQITHLATGACADKEMVEVRVYNPLAFLGNPQGTTPQAKVVTGTATYCFDDLVDQSGMGLIAIAITDPMGPVKWTLAGVGQNNVAPGQSFRVDAFIVENALVATWDVAAGLAPKTLEMDGAYVGRFIDTPPTDETGAKGVAGVTMQMGNAAAPKAFYFKGDLMTIDKAATATDGTGTVVQDVIAGNLTTYSGVGGMILGAPVVKWEAFPGASTAGVVFIQKFHKSM